MSQARKILNDLESTGKYFFHGSADPHELLEPRQARTVVNGEWQNDDDPGIHVSPSTETAIYMALMNGRNCPEGLMTAFTVDSDKGIEYSASQKTLDQLKSNPENYAFVHVIRRESSDFKRRDAFQYVSYQTVKPEQIIKVQVEDLPKDIKIIPNEPIH